jgi:hypothetical protein
VIALRKRLGQAARYEEDIESCSTSFQREPEADAGETAGGEDVRVMESGGGGRERVFSWFDVARAGAQLTLDVIRVIREASDLYRKLSRGTGSVGK